jgi:6-phosphogluconolactonase
MLKNSCPHYVHSFHPKTLNFDMMAIFRPPLKLALILVLLGADVDARAALPSGGLERFYIGTYSDEIYLSSLDLGTKKFGAVFAAGNDTNDISSFQPSFVALTPNRKFLYSVDENNGTVLAYSVNPTNGSLKFLNLMSSQGQTPAFIVVDRSGNNVLVANYNAANVNNGGSVTVFPIQTNGSIGMATAHIQDPGISHAHCIAIDGNNHFAFVADLGLDQVRCFVFDPVAGTLTTNTTLITSVPKGSGPRHMTFDPQYQRAYLICQNSSTVIGFNYDSTNGILTPFQTNSTLPPGGFSGNQTAEIAVHPSGRFLYGSNRGYNSIVVYTINPTNGTLTLVLQELTDAFPRNFAIDPTGGYCIVAAQNGNTIKLYSINQQTGKLTYANQLITAVSAPVCILPFIFEPPQPVLTLLPSSTNGLALNISNSSSLFTYQLYESPTLPFLGMSWNLVATGSPGQTNFMWTNTLTQEFFMVGVLTNY